MILMCGIEERIHQNYRKQHPKARYDIPSYEHQGSTTIKAVLSLQCTFSAINITILIKNQEKQGETLGAMHCYHNTFPVVNKTINARWASTLSACSTSQRVQEPHEYCV